MPSGGRRSTTWKKGEKPPKKSPGRPKGSKDKIPRTWKGSLRALAEEYATAHPDEIFSAIQRGIKAAPPHSHQYLQLMKGLIDGKDDDLVALKQVHQLLLAMSSLFVSIVPDDDSRLRWAMGVRRLTGVMATTVIDAEPQTKV